MFTHSSLPLHTSFSSKPAGRYVLPAWTLLGVTSRLRPVYVIRISQRHPRPEAEAGEQTGSGSGPGSGQTWTQTGQKSLIACPSWTCCQLQPPPCCPRWLAGWGRTLQLPALTGGRKQLSSSDLDQTWTRPEVLSGMVLMLRKLWPFWSNLVLDWNLFLTEF